MPLNARDERGFTMIAAVVGMSLVATLTLVAVTAVSGDISLTRGDLDRRQAYEAAKAGVNEYAFHLKTNNSYWTKCTEVPPPNAVNQQGAKPLQTTEGTRQAPARNTQSSCCPPPAKQHANPAIDRPRPTACSRRAGRCAGRSGSARPASRAKRRSRSSPPSGRSSFLDYVYFTQLETSDPSGYAFPNPSPRSKGPTHSAKKCCRIATSQETPSRSKKPGGTASRSTPKSIPKREKSRIEVLPGDLLRQRRFPQRAAAHQRRVRDLRQPERSGAPTQTTRSRSARCRPGWYSTERNPRWLELQRRSPTFDGTYLINSPALIATPDQRRAEEHRRTAVQVQRPGANLPQRSDDDGRQHRHLHRPLQRRLPCQRRHLRRKRRLLRARLLAVHRHLSRDLGMRQRLRPRQILRSADDRRRKRHRRRRAICSAKARARCWG